MGGSKLIPDVEIYLEKLRELDSDQTVHYNCAQKVIIPFAEKCGISEEQGYALGMHLGGGMKMGSVCGVIAAGAIVIGMMGGSDMEYQKFLGAIKNLHDGDIDCAVLLRKNARAGGDRKTHCDGMIREAIEAVLNVMS